MFITIHKGLAQHIHLSFLNLARCSSRRVTGTSLKQCHAQKSIGPRVQARSQSTTSSSHDSEPPRVATSWLRRGSSVRVSTLFTALLALGAGATALGLYVAHLPSNNQQSPTAFFFSIYISPTPSLQNAATKYTPRSRYGQRNSGKTCALGSELKTRVTML